MPWPSLQHRTQLWVQEKTPPSEGGRKAKKQANKDSVPCAFPLCVRFVTLGCFSSDISNARSVAFSVIVASLQAGRRICSYLKAFYQLDEK